MTKGQAIKRAITVLKGLEETKENEEAVERLAEVYADHYSLSGDKPDEYYYGTKTRYVEVKKEE